MINKIKVILYLFNSKDFINISHTDGRTIPPEKNIILIKRLYGRTRYNLTKIESSMGFGIRYARKKIREKWTECDNFTPRQLITWDEQFRYSHKKDK